MLNDKKEPAPNANLPPRNVPVAKWQKRTGTKCLAILLMSLQLL